MPRTVERTKSGAMNAECTTEDAKHCARSVVVVFTWHGPAAHERGTPRCRGVLADPAIARATRMTKKMVPLPIDSSLPQIIESLRTSRSLVLVAPPGAGKTT